MAILKLTKSNVEALPFVPRGQILYHDTDLKGFGLIVGASCKTYFVQRSVNNQKKRISIGRHSLFTTEEAKRQARILLADMSRGLNPQNEKRMRHVKAKTLGEALQTYIAMKQNLSPRSKAEYNYVVENYLADWKSKSLDVITKEMVMHRNLQIRTINGGPTANKVMRILSAIYNNAKLFNDSLPENPVIILSRAKLWYSCKRRQTVIKPYELRRWYAAVIADSNTTIRDYLLLLLFTGMRKTEGLSLSWSNIDFDDKSLTLPETKNGHILKLPLSEHILALLQSRYEQRLCDIYVFPGGGRSRHLKEPKKALNRIKRSTGISFMLHDLRRTFITVAESLEISSYAIKYLINHKTNNDLTGGYIVFDIDRLREPVQRVSQKLLELLLEHDCPKLPETA